MNGESERFGRKRSERAAPEFICRNWVKLQKRQWLRRLSNTNLQRYHIDNLLSENSWCSYRMQLQCTVNLKVSEAKNMKQFCYHPVQSWNFLQCETEVSLNWNRSESWKWHLWYAIFYRIYTINRDDDDSVACFQFKLHLSLVSLLLQL
jgi:hypothetical protein